MSYPPEFDFRAHLQRQRDWSEATFGPGLRTSGILDHIRKELDNEVAVNPHDITEWIDVVILALDGAWRHGATPDQIIAALEEKQAKNMARTWPDWRTMSEDRAIEHDRTGEAPALTERQIDIARHALGLDWQKTAFRNRYVVGSGPDHTELLAMVENGYAVRRQGNELTGGDDLFMITDAGKALVVRPGESLE